MTEFVYVIGAPNSGRVKIGWSNDVDRRLGEIQSMSPVSLVVQMTAEGDRELEAVLHRHFKDCRVHGEWFDLGDDAVKQVTEALAILRTEEWRGRGRAPEAEAVRTAIRRVGKARKRGREALREAIATAAKCGAKPGELIHASGLSKETVRKICRENGVAPLRSTEGRVRGLPADA